MVDADDEGYVTVDHGAATQSTHQQHLPSPMILRLGVIMGLKDRAYCLTEDHKVGVGA